MIRVLIADDEEHGRQRLLTLLKEYSDFEVVRTVDNGNELVPALITYELDAAFLDINMPGLGVFKSLSSLKKLPLIVFQTAYSEYAVKAFEVEALDYIMKPVSRERFSACVLKIRKALDQSTAINNISGEIQEQHDESKVRQISIKTGNKAKVIKVDHIIKIEVEEGLSFVYTNEGRFLTDKSLNYFMDLLPDDVFFRVSRTAIINMGCIKHLHPMFKGSYVVELHNQMKLPLSRRRMKAFKERITFL
ncbi:MAG: response regulator transcription factor [Spirochaetales bacterium]|nr:response regulator transcription factor [Spirochaetales bacterium]